jgi:hypothetical protein
MKPSLKIGPGCRLLQRQGGKDREMDRADRSPRAVEGIDDVIGLAETQREAHDQPGSNVADDVIGDSVRVRKNSWHRTSFILCTGPTGDLPQKTAQVAFNKLTGTRNFDYRPLIGQGNTGAWVTNPCTLPHSPFFCG